MDRHLGGVGAGHEVRRGEGTRERVAVEPAPPLHELVLHHRDVRRRAAEGGRAEPPELPEEPHERAARGRRVAHAGALPDACAVEGRAPGSPSMTCVEQRADREQVAADGGRARLAQLLLAANHRDADTDRDPGGEGGLHVLLGIADVGGARAFDRELREGVEQRLRQRLHDARRVAPDDRAEVVAPAEVRDQRACARLELRGDDAERQPGREVLEQLARAGQRRRVGHVALVVVRQVERVEALRLGLVDADRAPDHRLHARPELRHELLGARAVALLAERLGERHRDRGHRIGERAIEVEEHGVEPSRPALGRHPWWPSR